MLPTAAVLTFREPRKLLNSSSAHGLARGNSGLGWLRLLQNVFKFDFLSAEMRLSKQKTKVNTSATA